MIIPIGYAQINAIHTGEGAPTGAQWTLGVDITGFSGSPSDLAQAFETWVLDSGIYALVSSSITMTSVLVKFGPNATGPSHLEPANQPGTETSDMVPNTCYLVHKNTADGGRAGRGRAYVPGVPESDVTTSGTLVSGRASAMNTALATFQAAMEADLVNGVVLHGAGSPLSTPSVITGFSCDAKAATQRRRLRR